MQGIAYLVHQQENVLPVKITDVRYRALVPPPNLFGRVSQ
jgi:hypothetical protein